MSDEETISVTPGEAFLKKIIKKITLDKRKLQLKNYKLVRDNKRLKEKCKNLELKILELEK